MSNQSLLGYLDVSVKDSQLRSEAAMKQAATTGETIDFLAAQESLGDTQIKTSMYSGMLKALHDMQMKIVSSIN
ncbi:hypothetical protein [Cupriavidus pampae]|uniref:Uncharacterized protein n=1 Tax=Cupriavidus pampae TaxID=659251 RepID=A0ABM8XZY3_9BURK|nr:hypothetical protein [Cupriavidus pampae]CAG9185906.1 hypothetical protein LMG32289_06154 [Cupriavidus pampae]